MLASKIVAFCAHCPDRFSLIAENGHEVFQALKESTSQAIVQAVSEGCETFLCGMNRGFELVAASVFLELRNNKMIDEKVKLVAVLPFAGHGYSDPWQVLHQLVRVKADEEVTLAPKYYAEATVDHQKYLVESSARLICCREGLSDARADGNEQPFFPGLEIVNSAEFRGWC